VRFEYPRQLVAALSQLRVSLLISTYQAGKLVVAGASHGELALSFLNFERVMGFAVRPDRIAARSHPCNPPAVRRARPALAWQDRGRVAVPFPLRLPSEVALWPRQIASLSSCAEGTARANGRPARGRDRTTDACDRS
jgi:hypothetical protein